MNTPLNIKKITLIVTGIVAVVALGVFLGRGNLFKGSFVGTESDAIPAPTNVKITQDAGGKYILSWDYDKDVENASRLTYKTLVDIHAAAFTWTISDANTGAVIGSDDPVHDVSPTTALNGPGILCNAKLTDADMGDTFDGFVCHDVFLSDAIVAQLTPEKGTIIRVRAYTGVVALDSGEPPVLVRQISKPGVGEYTLSISAAKPVDTVSLTLTDEATGQPLALAWNWNDATYQPSATNSLFADHDNHYFGYAWEITDVTDPDKKISIYKKHVFDDPGTIKVLPGQDPAQSEAAKQACLVNPSGFNGKIWICSQAYVPYLQGFVNKHSYTATVTVYNGVKDAAGELIPSGLKTSNPFIVKTPAAIVPPGALDNLDITLPAKEGDPVTFTYGWIDRGIEPSATSTTFKDAEGKYQFVYEAFVQDHNDSNGKVLWHNNFGIPPSQHNTLITGYAPPKPAITPAAGYESCLATVNGTQAWVCQKGYVPSDISLTPGKTYSLTVNAYSSSTTGYPENYIQQTYETFVMPDFTPKLTPPKNLDYVNVVFPDVKGDPITFNYGWNNPSVKLNAADTSLVDVNGNYQFVYHITVQDEAGNVVWNNEKGSSSTLFALNPNMKECIVYIANTRSWICQNAYLPMQLDAGKTYSVRVATYFSDAMSTQYIEKKFTTPVAVVLPTDTTAPKVVSATSLTQNKVKVVFSEKVKLPATAPESAFTIINTNYNNADGTPGSLEVTGAVLDPDDQSGVTVILTTEDQGLKMPYVLSVGNSITDLAGNAIIPSDTTTFSGTAVQPPVLDYVNVTLPSKTGEKITFAYGWNDSSVKPNASNTFLKDSNNNYQFVYHWVIRDDKDTQVWAGNKPFGNVSEDPTCSIPMSTGSYGWICKNNSVPLNAALKPGQTYTLGVQTWFKNNYSTFLTFSKPFTIPATTVTPLPFVQPLNPMGIPPTMTLKNLSVKKLTDGNVALTYTVDLAGTWTATEFNHEVRLNDSKIFVAKFNESSLKHMSRSSTAGPTTSYTYEVVLLPWEIKAGDKVKVFMNADGLNTPDLTNDGQFVVYDAGAKILDAVVGLVTANALPSATVGSPYSAAIVVKDGVAPYKYIVGAGSSLPEGLSLNPLTGVLSGTPTKDNSYAFGLSITDAKNAALNATFTLKVVPAPVAGTVVVTSPPASGGTTIINNYTTYNPVAPVAPVTPVVPATPGLPSAPPSNRYLFPVNLGSSLFQDVTYHWARNYINVLWNAGFVQGYTGRTFGPDDSLTRAQLLKIVMESLHYKLPTKVTYNPCVDVQTNQWYAKYFAVAREKGIIGGYTDGTCRPNKVTNRAESLKILYAAIAQMPEVPVTKVTATVPAGFRNTFYDLNENSWYYSYFANAQSLGIISGFADETARPDSELSRAQMAKIVVLMMQKLAWAQ